MTQERLFDRFMNDRLYGNETFAYAKAVLQTGVSGAPDSVLAYVARYGSPAAVQAVVQAERSELGPWLQSHADELGVRYWSEISSTIMHSSWRDSTVVKVLMNHALHANTPTERALAAGVFPAIGTTEEVRILAEAADSVSADDVYWAMISGLSRFDTLTFNQRLCQALEDADHLAYYVAEGLRMHNRYDFLPELRALEDRSQQRLSELRALRKRQGEDEVEITYARENDPEEIAELIAYLETKRADGAPLGVSLDYPNSTRRDSISQ